MKGNLPNYCFQYNRPPGYRYGFRDKHVKNSFHGVLGIHTTALFRHVCPRYKQHDAEDSKRVQT